MNAFQTVYNGNRSPKIAFMRIFLKKVNPLKILDFPLKSEHALQREDKLSYGQFIEDIHHEVVAQPWSHLLYSSG